MRYSFERNFKDVAFVGNKIDDKENKNHKEHLTKDFRPIMACVGTPEHFNGIGSLKQSTDDEQYYEVNYYDKHERLISNGFKNPETSSYVISSIDNFNKHSSEFANCTGVFVVGYDKEFKENVSFMSHEDPDYFLETKKNLNIFKKDFEGSLNEIKDMSEPGSIDAVIFGGNFFHKNDAIKFYKEYQRHYIESIKLLAYEIEKILGFEPKIIIGPKTTYGHDDIYFDNKNRRIYISRPEVGNASTLTFSPSEFEEHLKKL